MTIDKTRNKNVSFHVTSDNLKGLENMLHVELPIPRIGLLLYIYNKWMGITMKKE